MPDNIFTLQAEIEVVYDLNGVTPEALKDRLSRAIRHMYADGELTGTSSAEVDSFRFTVRDGVPIAKGEPQS